MDTVKDDPAESVPVDFDSPSALEDFLPHVGEMFAAALPEGTAQIELVAARAIDDQPGMGFEDSFSLRFRAEPDCPIGQGSVALDHPTVGWVVLFLAPAGEDEDGRYFEAVFN